MKSELTPRQWALYNYLKKKGDEWTTQLKTACDLLEYYGNLGDYFPNFHDCAARLQMTADIRAINDSDVIQKVIISSPKGIKLANSEEFDKYIRKEIMAAVRKLMRAKRKAEKGNRDGQMRITFNSGRDTVKAFIDSDKHFGERLKLCRIKKNYSQSEVICKMRELGDNTFDAPMLSKFENGYCMPCKRTLDKLADIYGVSVDYLLTGELSPEAETPENYGLQAVK